MKRQQPDMNGAEILINTAVTAGVEVCFTNPGTTELPVVRALASAPGIKAILGLFEGVCTGAADGYGRMLDKPALTLLHLGPGFANGIANLHNARKARTPLLNLVGEHATWHRNTDAPLSMNIEALSSTVSAWFRTSESPTALSHDAAEAIAASRYGQISTLIVPHDIQMTDCTGVPITRAQFSFDPVDSNPIDRAARMLKTHTKKALVMGGRALRRRGLQAAARIKAATQCELITEHLPPYIERGVGLPDVIRIPYFPGPAVRLLSQFEAIVLVGVKEPVTFFGYQGYGSHLLGKGQKRVQIATGKQDTAEVLEHLAEALDSASSTKTAEKIVGEPERPSIPRGELTPDNICLTLAALQPENAIIVDEGITTSSPYYQLSAGLPRHSLLTSAGGSIGYGIPCALGAAVACPDRPVISLQADGSAMYTIQALWTQAREGLRVITLICSNSSYNILKTEVRHTSAIPIDSKILSLLDLDNPAINWERLAGAMGVPATSVNSTDGLAKSLNQALAEAGPHLIEMVMPASTR